MESVKVLAALQGMRPKTCTLAYGILECLYQNWVFSVVVSEVGFMEGANLPNARTGSHFSPNSDKEQPKMEPQLPCISATSQIVMLLSFCDAQRHGQPFAALAGKSLSFHGLLLRTHQSALQLTNHGRFQAACYTETGPA